MGELTPLVKANAYIPMKNARSPWKNISQIYVDISIGPLHREQIFQVNDETYRGTANSESNT
jgi:hypothetical protein